MQGKGILFISKYKDEHFILLNNNKLFSVLETYRFWLDISHLNENPLHKLFSVFETYWFWIGISYSNENPLLSNYR